MIWFWIFSATLSVIVVRILLWPGRQKCTHKSTQANNVAWYLEQLHVLEENHTLGMNTAHETEMLKNDIGRQLLDANQVNDSSSKSELVSESRSRLLVWILGVVPLLALGIYLPLGRPDLPSHPYRSQHIRIDNQAPAILREFAITSIQTNNGIVSFEVQRAFEELLKHNPYDPQARFFLALAQAQKGKLQDAMVRWACLIETSPAHAPWLPAVRDQLTQIAQQLGKSPEDVIPKPFLFTAQRILHEQNSDTDTTMAPECYTMVTAITTALEHYLNTQPNDVDRWLILAQSYDLLGKRQTYHHALRQAFIHQPDRLDVLLAYGLSLFHDLPDQQPLPDDVVDIMNKIQTYSPDNPEILWILGLDAFHRGLIDKASERWNKALLHLPSAE